MAIAETQRRALVRHPSEKEWTPAAFLLWGLRRGGRKTMHVSVSRPNLAGLAVFWGWSILVNARDSVERAIAARLRHPMGTVHQPPAQLSKNWN